MSSTLAELADERAAVARAITALRLTPVLFELGARPHPPRELYRAYLAQSDLFVGLYWQRYGWVGPGMEISGLEDEYQLSRSLPRLLYVKMPAPEREPRLAAMLDRVRSEGGESYRTFRTPRELGALVRDDLAVLLSERFAGAARPEPASAGAGRQRSPLPVPGTALIGREREIEQVRGLLESPQARLVMLVGPGGIGKTRLAIAVGQRLATAFPGGPTYVPLGSITEPDLVLASIATAAGAAIEGSQPPLEVLATHLDGTPSLLVLDNLEQVIEAAPQLDELLARCPKLKILATSRSVLRLRAERDYPVPALAVPAAGSGAAAPAVELFVDRARAVRPDFTLTDETAPVVAEICRRLDGLPLAIELAAARVRLLSPAGLLARLTDRVDALGAGPVDLPERQRTLRATVDWSVGLLDQAERQMLATLTVFVDGWTIPAAASVSRLPEDRTLDLLDTLAGHSLVQVTVAEDEPRFRMLGTIREYAGEELAADPGRAAEVGGRHAQYFRELVERADRPLRGQGQPEWAERLQAELGNLRAAVRWFLAHDIAPLPHLVRALWPFLSRRDHIAEARGWIQELLPRSAELGEHPRAELLWSAVVTNGEAGDDPATLAAVEQLTPLLDRIDDPYLEGVSQLAIAWAKPIAGDLDGALRAAARSYQRLRDLDEPFMTAQAAANLGIVEMVVGRDDDALRHLAEASRLGDRSGNIWLEVSPQVHLGILAVRQGRLAEARALLYESVEQMLEADLGTNIVTYWLVALVRLALAEGHPDRAALGLGAVDGLRRRAGLRVWPLLRRSEAELRAEVERALGPDRFRAAFQAGSDLNRREAAAAVRGSRI